MTEDVDEEQRFSTLGFLVRFQPSRDLRQERFVVLHVLHHLDSDDSVEAGARRGSTAVRKKKGKNAHLRVPLKSYTLTSPVKTSMFLSPLRAACESIKIFCVAEFDKEVILEFGYFFRTEA